MQITWPGAKRMQFDAVAQMVDEILPEAAKDGDVAQMRIERAAPVGFVELRAERLALLQDVENVAQHLEHHAIGFGAHGRGPRVIIHAGHFAEQFARPEFGDGMVVGEVDRGVDRNRAPVRFVFAAVFLARGTAGW